MRAKYLLLVVSTLCFNLACLGQRQKPNAEPQSGPSLPKIELRGGLAKIFAVTRCEYISGLTCRIHYNGAAPLPSEVFFTEFDKEGHLAGPRVRLIYPQLNPGETGVGTFRIRLPRPTV